MFKLALTPLVPVLSLTLGAVITKIAARFVTPRQRDALALLIAGGAFFAPLLLACQPASHVVISPWHSLTLLGSQLAYTTAELAAPLALLMSLICLAVVISLSKWQKEADDNGESPLYPTVFVVSAAGLSFVYSANLVTLCLSWAFLDLGLLFFIVGQGHNQMVPDAQGRALMISSLTSLGLVMAALLLESPNPAFSPSLLLLAALVRVGSYPVHFWMLNGTEIESKANALFQSVSIIAGLSLLAKLQELSSQGLLYQSRLAVISSLALLATALSAWAEQDRRRAVSWVALNQVALAVLAVAVIGQSKSAVLWSAISLALCFGLLNLWLPEPAKMGRYGLWFRVPTGLALASLMGLPFTIGFVTRVTLYRFLLALGQPYLWGLSIVADTVLFAALFGVGTDLLSTPLDKTAPSEWAAWVPYLASAVILAVPLVLLGGHPPLARFLAADVTLPVAAALISGANITLWAVLLLPLVGGYLLHQGQKAVLKRSAAFWKGLAALLRLDWLYRWLWTVGRGVGAVWRGLARVIEGEGYLGWTLLLAFMAFLLLSSN